MEPHERHPLLKIAGSADLNLLAVLAYSQLLAHRHDEALCLYRLLCHLEPEDARWWAGATLCHAHRKDAAAAAQTLAAMEEQCRAPGAIAALHRLRRRVAFLETLARTAPGETRAEDASA